MDTMVQHQNIGQKYRFVIERVGSAKGILGYKIEANGDDFAEVCRDMALLKFEAERIAGESVAQEKNGA